MGSCLFMSCACYIPAGGAFIISHVMRVGWLWLISVWPVLPDNGLHAAFFQDSQLTQQMPLPAFYYLSQSQSITSNSAKFALPDFPTAVPSPSLCSSIQHMSWYKLNDQYGICVECKMMTEWSCVSWAKHVGSRTPQTNPRDWSGL